MSKGVPKPAQMKTESGAMGHVDLCDYVALTRGRLLCECFTRLATLVALSVVIILDGGSVSVSGLNNGT